MNTDSASDAERGSAYDRVVRSVEPEVWSASIRTVLWIQVLILLVPVAACAPRDELRPGLEFESVVARPEVRNNRVHGECHVFQISAGGYEWVATLPLREDGSEYEGRLVIIEAGGEEMMWGMAVFVPDGMPEFESLISAQEPNAITEYSPHTGWCGP